MTSLPVELIERVVDYIGNDPSTLKHCARTHSAFLPRCRVHLFQKVVLFRQQMYCRFQKLVEEAPHLSGLTTSLVLMDLENTTSYTSQFPILPILDLVPNIRSLSVRSNFPMSWEDICKPIQDTLILAVSRHNITSVSLDYEVSGYEAGEERFLRCCAGKVRHLVLDAPQRGLTRASLDDRMMHLESFCVVRPAIAPEELVPKQLPLLDFSGLRRFDVPLGHILQNYSWIWKIGTQASHTLQTLVWNLSGIHLDTSAVDIYPLSQLPALQSLQLNFSDRNTKFSLFLRRLMDTRFPFQVLKSLKITCSFWFHNTSFRESSLSGMKEFLGSLTHVEHTELSCTLHLTNYELIEKQNPEAPEEHKRYNEEAKKRQTEALEKIQECALGGEYPGTSCSFNLRTSVWPT